MDGPAEHPQQTDPAGVVDHPRAPRVDAATHVWSADPRAFPWAPIDGVELPDAGAEADTLLETLETWDFDSAVCVQPRVYGFDHAYLEASLARHPGRLAGVFLLDPLDPDAVSRLQCHVTDGGCSGVRLIALAEEPPPWLDGPPGDPIWEAAAALDVPVSLLVSPGCLDAVARRAGRSPQTTIVIDHLGLVGAGSGAGPRASLLRCAAPANVSVKVSALGELSAEPWPHMDLEPLVREVLAAFGPDRVVFGTDWPYALEHGPWQDQRLAIAEGWDLGGADVDGLFGANAANLWKLGVG